MTTLQDFEITHCGGAVVWSLLTFLDTGYRLGVEDACVFDVLRNGVVHQLPGLAEKLGCNVLWFSC